MAKVTVMGYPTNLGLPVPVQTYAPAVLRSLEMVERLQETGATVQDLGDLPLPDGTRMARGPELLRAVVRAAEAQAQAMQPHLDQGGLFVTIGGDHSTSLGSAMGLARAGLTFDIVWIDAHGDFNVPETSPSGNPHGMVLALLAGLTEYLPLTVPPARMVILGARDIDPGERELLARHGVQVYSVAETLARQEEIIAGLGPRVFLSFDLDSLDPAYAPAVRTPVPGGFTPEQAKGLVQALGQGRDLLAIDVVEYSPDLDRGTATGAVALEVLAAAVATQGARLVGQAHS